MHPLVPQKTTATIVSIQVGEPQTYGQEGADDPMDRRWTTAFFKEPVTGPRHFGQLGIEGDGQADTKVHGGVDKAVLAYAANHYDEWRNELEKPGMPYGAFGENLTLSDLTEAEVCIGDVWQSGEVCLQVSQPRQPCWKMARRWRMKQLPKRVIQTGRSGWYLRVLSEGSLTAGAELQLTNRPHDKWTITRANQAMYGELDRVSLVELAALEELSDAWKADLA